MNVVDSQKLHDGLLKDDVVVTGFMPQDDSHDVADLLYWLLAEKHQVGYTSSSDVAGIAYCLCHLSFEILTVENFGHSPASGTGCRLVYNKAPLFTGRETGSSDSRRNESRRGLSTTISLTQPEETFSTFPISRELIGCERLMDMLGHTFMDDYPDFHFFRLPCAGEPLYVNQSPFPIDAESTQNWGYKTRGVGFERE